MSVHTSYAALRTAHLSRANGVASHLRTGQFFSHETAALMWGLPAQVTAQTPITVSSIRGVSRIQRRGIRSVQVGANFAEIVFSHEKALGSPAHTWAVLAPSLPVADAIALGDAVLHRPRIGGTSRYSRQPLATRKELERITATPYRPHRALLANQLQQLTEHAASVPESHLRLLLASWGYPPEALDYDVRNTRGEFLGCSEIAYPRLRVAVEYEGDHHRVTTRQWNRDIEKYSAYAAAGWHTLRVTASLLYRYQHELRTRTEALLGAPLATIA